MADKTVVLNSQVFAGSTGLTLYLIHPETGELGNGSGDTLTPGNNGHFSAVVTEAITGWWLVIVKQGTVPAIANDLVYFPNDVEGTYYVNPNYYTLTSPNPITPSPPGQTTGYWTVYNDAGEVMPDADVVLSIAQLPKSSTGLAVDGATRTETSDSNGVVAFTGLFPGATYRVGLSDSQKRYNVTVPPGSSGTTPLGSIWG